MHPSGRRTSRQLRAPCAPQWDSRPATSHSHCRVTLATIATGHRQCANNDRMNTMPCSSLQRRERDANDHYQIHPCSHHRRRDGHRSPTAARSGAQRVNTPVITVAALLITVVLASEFISTLFGNKCSRPRRGHQVLLYGEVVRTILVLRVGLVCHRHQEAGVQSAAGKFIAHPYDRNCR